MTTNKSKVSSHTTPADETLVRPLQMDRLKELAKAYEFGGEKTSKKLIIYAAGVHARCASLKHKLIFAMY